MPRRIRGWLAHALRTRRLTALLATLAASLTVTVLVVGDTGRGGERHRTIEIKVGGRAQAPLPVTPSAREFDSPPPGDALSPAVPPPPAVAERQAEQVEQGTYDTTGVLLGATAQPAHRSCYTPQNGGTRQVSEIGLMVAHVTVSRNVPGTGDGDALCDFFRRVKASPTWTVDNEANSWENVPLGRVPWTQAWYNRASCSIEYIGSTGRPGEGTAEWTDAQLREGGRLFARCAKLAGIPIRDGAVDSRGNILRTGLITHQELGRLGGGHTDPGPYWDRARQLYWIRQFATAATAPRGLLNARERAHARCLEFERRVAQRHGGWSRVHRSHLERAVKCKSALRTDRARIGRAARRDGWQRWHRRARYRVLAQIIG